MFLGFEDPPAIGPFALKDAGAIVQTVAQQVYVRMTPVYQIAIHPDVSIAIVVTGFRCHGSLQNLHALSAHAVYIFLRLRGDIRPNLSALACFGYHRA